MSRFKTNYQYDVEVIDVDTNYGEIRCRTKISQDGKSVYRNIYFDSLNDMAESAISADVNLEHFYEHGEDEDEPNE